MDNKLMDNLTNPVRAKIFFEIYAGGQPTVKQLMEKFPDVSQSTIYRYLKAMLGVGMIKVVSEKQVRNVREKAYAVNTNVGADIERIIKHNDSDRYFQLFMQYIINLVSEFNDYCDSDKINIAGDGSGFSVAPFYATKEELLEALQKVSEIIMPLLKNEHTPERKLYNLCTIIIPPKEVKA